MKLSTKLLVLAAVGLLALGGRVVLAHSDEHESEHEAGTRSEIGYNNNDNLIRHDKEQRHGLRTYSTGDPINPVHWRVSEAKLGANGKLSLIKYAVPMRDMEIFGDITRRLAANGIQAESADAVFSEPDDEMPVPHYHFTQRFSTGR